MSLRHIKLLLKHYTHTHTHRKTKMSAVTLSRFPAAVKSSLLSRNCVLNCFMRRHSRSVLCSSLSSLRPHCDTRRQTTVRSGLVLKASDKLTEDDVVDWVIKQQRDKITALWSLNDKKIWVKVQKQQGQRSHCLTFVSHRPRSLCLFAQ